MSVILILPFLVAVLQAAPASPEPFFTNDGAGVIKVVGFLTTPIVLVLGILVKVFMSGRDEKIKDLERHLNGYGERLTDAERELAEFRGLMLEQVRQGERNALELGMVREGTGRVEKSLDTLTTLVQQSATQIARLQERDRIVEQLEAFTRNQKP